MKIFARAAPLLAAILQVSCSTEAGVTMETPASIELSKWCSARADGCDQAAADEAQAHCRATGLNAQLTGRVLVERSLTKGEKFDYRFNCVK
jgi:hypothetical protein